VSSAGGLRVPARGMQYADARLALIDANAEARHQPIVVGWSKEQRRWRLYPASAGAPEGVEAEILVARRGMMLPLTQTACNVLMSALSIRPLRHAK